ncbi:MAG TPA: 5-oxoprolinase subunit PxpB [Candidatus Nanopelagicales bacterium]|nr:5-oxoprolinase subunit PxpB [Candidatus Nanopelagicales bacterium]
MADPAGRRRGPRVDRMGDAALLLTLGDVLDLEVNAWAHRVAAGLAVRRPSVPGLGVAVPGHAGVLAPFDPEICAEETVRAILEAVVDEMAGPRAPGDGVRHEIRVSYGGADGPDLPEVASRTGLSEADVVRLHAGLDYRVLVLGFVPGFPYLGTVPERLDLPRRATPRLRVPAGSVAIAGRQSGIYPFATPGGWHLIGRTEAPMWDPRRDPPALLAPGDRVRFVPG